MTDRSEVSATQIASLAGVSRAAVSNWRKRHPGFPSPVGGSESSPTFSRQAVEEWLRAEGKLGELPEGELLWRAVDGENGSAGTTGAVLGAVGEVLAAAPSNAWQKWLNPGLVGQVCKLADTEGPDTVFEQLLGKYLNAYARDLDTGTAIEPLAQLMAQLADAGKACVYDPSCGSGILLAAAARLGASSLIGQTAEPVLAPLAASRIMLAGDGDAVTGPSVTIRPGNALLADAHPGLTADAVLCQPPTAERDWGLDELPYDPRWEYGMPPRAESELAWVQHALARLRPGAAAVLLLPQGVAARRPGRRIRAELLRRGALRAVIGLPAGSAAPYGLPLHLWVLRRPQDASPPPNRLLFVDQSSAAGIAESADTARRILTAWRTFEQSPDDYAGEPGFSAARPVIELLDDTVDLSPGRHVPRPETELGRANLLESRTTVESVLAQLAGLLPDLGPDPSPGLRWPMATLGDLARTQALTILADTAIEAEDVVVPVLGGEMSRARVVAAGDPLIGTVPGRGVAALRPDPSLLDPWFVVGFLRSDAAARQSVSYASTMSRMDIRKVLLPRLPLDRQRDYAAAFRRIADFGDALRQAVDLGERLAQGITDALAKGTVLPDQHEG